MERYDAGELNDRGFGRCVRDIGNTQPADTRNGSDVHDRPLALPLHVGKHMLAGQEHALQVDVVDPIPTLLASLYWTADFDDADIVVQYVDPAKCRDTGAHYRSDMIGTGHVSGDRQADAALALDDPFGLDGGIEVEVGGEDLCSLAGEEHRRRLAVAPARAARSCSRNQSHLVFEPIAHAFPPLEAIAMCAHPPCRDNQACDSLQATVRAASGPNGNSAPMRSSPNLIRLRRNEQERIWRWRDICTHSQ